MAHAAGTLARFVVVPFLPARQPALGVSSLLSVLKERGIDGDVRYLNLTYGERLGWDLYVYLTGRLLPNTFLPGEMIFSRALWGDRAPDFAAYEERVTRWIEELIGNDPGLKTVLTEWKSHVPAVRDAIEAGPKIVAEWADEVLADSPRVLGFTSTFQQSVAALALAQEVRRRVPPEEVAIMFGGANCEDDMGRALADNFDFIDCVVSGEAESVIVDLVTRLVDRRHRDGVPRFVQGTMVRDMDALPLPRFDDYFSTVERTTLADDTCLVAESSRGCWWGQKSHCTFCGLNGGSMAFRSKSAARFASELETLSDTYGTTRFALTDNILDMSYLRTLIPELVAQAKQYQLFYETKSNLRKDQVELLAAAGVSYIQPGIESFSSPILKLMGKGTTRLQNIQLLKWCAELGVVVAWNVLYGFPGEDPAEYRDMADLLPSLFHLPPPNGASTVRLDRFGPYWKSPDRHGICNLRHHWSYDYVFAGLPIDERDRLAYFFEHEYVDGRNPDDYARPVAELTTRWREASRAKVRLELQPSPDGPRIVDTRPCRVDELYAVTPAGLALLRALDGYRGSASVLAAVQEQGVAIGERELHELVADFIARRFVTEEHGSLMSLVIDPRERRRVAERQVALRAGRFGFRWPDDFPDPDKQSVVRAAMLSLGGGVHALRFQRRAEPPACESAT